MKYEADSYFNCTRCEDLVEPGDLITHVPGEGPICEDCRQAEDDFPPDDEPYGEDEGYV